MKTINQGISLTLIAFAILGLSGCGAGKKLVQDLDFTTVEEDGHFVAGFDVKVEMGMGILPEFKLPIYDPNSPTHYLGYVETRTDGMITVRVDVNEAVKLPNTDGMKLPNGRDIPIALPAGVLPIAIPVVNSNSKVYLAVGQQNIMAGVALALEADSSEANGDWLRILQQLPANLFYPFQIATDLKGTAGIFTGNKVGVAVFAVKTLPSFREVKDEVFGVKTQYPIGYKMVRIKRALESIRETQLD